MNTNIDAISGIPKPTLALSLLVIVGALLLILLILALKYRVLLRMSVRNILRRPRRSLLIICGLMLSTVLITTSLGLGDSVEASLKSALLPQVGNLDEGLSIDLDSVVNAPTYFRQDEVQQISALTDPHIDKVAGALLSGLEQVKAYAPSSQQISAKNQVLAVAPDFDAVWGTLYDNHANRIHFADLQSGQVYMGTTLASKLNVNAGDQVLLSIGQRRIFFTVRAVLSSDVNPDTQGNSANKVLILPLSQYRQLIQAPAGAVNIFYIKNQGQGGIDDLGPDNSTSKAVVDHLHLLFPLYAIQSYKQAAVSAAENVSANTVLALTSVGIFVDIAGFLLIYLIFVMLAAERRSELGMSRAMGMQQYHLVLMYVFEGTLYALMSALIGVSLGVALVPFSIAARLSSPTSLVSSTIDQHFSVTWPSLLIAFCGGVLLTFLVVTFSSYRVSQMNIIMAVRNLDERKRKRQTVPIGGLICLLLGAGVFVLGLQIRADLYMVGVSLLIMGVGLTLIWLLRLFGCEQQLAERIGFTVLGVGLLIYNVAPPGTFEKLLGVYNRLGIGQFDADNAFIFINAVLVLIGCVWIVMYDGDLLVRVIMAVGNHLGGLAPVIRTSMAYPLHFKFRTGMMVAMFAVVIFITTINLMFSSAQDQSTQSLALQSLREWPLMTSSAGLPADLPVQILSNPTFSREVELVAGQYRQTVTLSKQGISAPFILRGSDDTFLQNTHFHLLARAAGYATDQQVWDAVGAHQGLAVIGGPPLSTDVTGFQPYQVEVQNAQGALHQLTIIGHLQPLLLTPLTTSTYTSLSTMAALFPDQHIVPNSYWLRPRVGADIQKIRLDLGVAFGLKYGLEVEDQTTQYTLAQTTNNTQSRFLTSYLLLGLLAGIAALGVVSSRAVVERRQEIGMLRAVGYTSFRVLLSFLLEFSFIALIGLLTGAFIGVVIGNQLSIKTFVLEQRVGAIPFAPIIILLLVAYLFALCSTSLPAITASRVRPADALRYE